MAMLRGFITNLSLYNQGKLVGEWIEFPIDEEELNEVKKRIQIDENHEEYFFTDYECDDLSNFRASEISEHCGIDDLNNYGEKMIDADDKLLDAALVYHNLEEALEMVEDDRILYWGNGCNYGSDDEKIGHAFVDSCGSPQYLGIETLIKYFDYESFGRDLRDGDGFFVTEDGVFSTER